MFHSIFDVYLMGIKFYTFNDTHKKDKPLKSCLFLFLFSLKYASRTTSLSTHLKITLITCTTSCGLRLTRPCLPAWTAWVIWTCGTSTTTPRYSSATTRTHSLSPLEGPGSHLRLMAEPSWEGLGVRVSTVLIRIFRCCCLRSPPPASPWTVTRL